MRRDESRSAFDPISIEEELERSLEAVRRHVWDGKLELAIEALAPTIVRARREGREEIADRARAATCNIALELPSPAMAVASLRSLIAESRSRSARYVASSGLARHYWSVGKPKHGLFYARISVGLATTAELPRVWHSLAVCMLALNQSREAVELLARACDEWRPDVAPVELIVSALVYGETLLGRRTTAARHAQQCGFVQPPFSTYQSAIDLNLGFSWLELGHLELAGHHGARALATAPAAPSREHKCALYLLGETAAQQERVADSRSFFTQLVETYYAGCEGAWLIHAVRTAGLVNWLA